MKTMLRGFFIGGLLALVLGASASSAQERTPFQRAELDQMLAPIALYPDALLSQILIASTYPLEVVQAARWSRARPGLKGRDAVAAAGTMDWDPSVKSLTAFPQVLSMMDEQIEWTERLGEAFLGQQPDVMAAVQDLRRRAEAAGNLRSDERMQVVHQDGAVVIEPPASGIVYVPYYVPAVAYGGWWWPGYPPFAFAPPPVVTVISRYRPAFIWGDGILFSVGFFFGHFDWPRHRVEVVRVQHHPSHARPVYSRTVWRHEPTHRRGIPYRHAEARRAVSGPVSAPRHRAVTAPPTGARRIAAPAAAPRAATPSRRQPASASSMRMNVRRDAPAQRSRVSSPPPAKPAPDRGGRRIERAATRAPGPAYTHRAESRRVAPSARTRAPSASAPVTARVRQPNAPSAAATRGAPHRGNSKPARRGRDS